MIIQDEVEFANVDEVESLIGHRFNNPVILLEALTHPSCCGHSKTDSYQRLDFLGDAVLDMLTARYLATEMGRLSQGGMTRIRAALVNARLLGF